MQSKASVGSLIKTLQIIVLLRILVTLVCSNEDTYIFFNNVHPEINIRCVYFQISSRLSLKNTILEEVKFRKNKSKWKIIWLFLNLKLYFSYFLLINLILLCGDIEENPGPENNNISKDECPFCKKHFHRLRGLILRQLTMDVSNQTKYQIVKIKANRNRKVVAQTCNKMFMHQALRLLLLQLCGDVETNPGPSDHIHLNNECYAECPYCKKLVKRIKSHIKGSHKHNLDTFTNDVDLSLLTLELTQTSCVKDKSLNAPFDSDYGNQPGPSSFNPFRVTFPANRDPRYIRPYFGNISDTSDEETQPTSNDGEKSKEKYENFKSSVDKFTSIDNCISPDPVDIVNQIVKVKCSICGEEFKDSEINIHMSKTHGDLRKKSATTNKRSKQTTKTIREQKVVGKNIQKEYKNIATNKILQEEEIIKNIPVSLQSSEHRYKCQQCGRNFVTDKALSIHISKSHHSKYRENICEKYQTDHSCMENGLELPDECKTCLDNDTSSNIENWKQIFSKDLTFEEFNYNVTNFSKFLSDLIHKLPGPKHPARRYYELRKKNQTVSQNKAYKKNSNPERATKNDRKRRREKYLYEIIQFEFYNLRKRAVRKIMEKVPKSCVIELNTLKEQFEQRFSKPNVKILPKYRNVEDCTINELNNTYALDISEEEVLYAIRSMKVDSAPGPDKVFIRAIKVKKIAKVLSLIFSRMHKRHEIPALFRKARTILLDKGGDTTSVANWRPISICSALRRVYERILDKRLKDYVAFNKAQKGFTNVPGTHLNSNILDAILKNAKKEKKDCSVMFLDIEKAYDNVGHDHLCRVIDSKAIPTILKENIKALQIGNETQIETINGKTKSILINRGVLQGAPLSPTLYNLSIDHILDELSEQNIIETYGYRYNNSLPAITVLSFADDTVLIGKNKEAVLALYDMTNNHFKSIGLSLNSNKTNIININNGKIVSETYNLVDGKIQSINMDDKIKYLGVNFKNEIIFDKEKLLKNLNEKIKAVTISPYLKSNQKLCILNNYVWPTLTYKFQCAPLNKLNLTFLHDVDLVIRSAVKEVLELPNDIPNSMLYAPKMYKGLGITKASWEAYIQHINICIILKKEDDPYISQHRNFDNEIKDCLEKLEINNVEENFIFKSKPIRQYLQNLEFNKWCALKQKGKGTILFKECTSINKKINEMKGLTDSEYKDYLKMVGNIAPVRGIMGRSRDGNRCRHCPTTENYTIETLPHVLGQCPYGSLLRNVRHNRIRSLIADELRRKSFEVFEEVTATADDDSIRRSDIIVLDRKKSIGYIIDPTIRFEVRQEQPEEVNFEKNQIYSRTIQFYKNSYKIQDFEIIGLFIGSRGTISKFMMEFWKRFGLNQDKLYEIAVFAIKSSSNILKNHLYG